MKKLIGMVFLVLSLNGCSHGINAREYCAMHADEYNSRTECFADVRNANAQYEAQRAAAWNQAAQNMSHSFDTYRPVQCSSYAVGNTINTNCQ